MNLTVRRRASRRGTLAIAAFISSWIVLVRGDVYDALDAERPANGDALVWVLGAPIDDVLGSPSEGTVFRTSGLPPGVLLDEVSGRLSGTPLKAGRWTAYFETSKDGDVRSLQARQISVLHEAETTRFADTFSLIDEGQSEEVAGLGSIPGRVSFPDGLPENIVYDGVSRRITGNFHTPGLFEFSLRIAHPIEGPTTQCVAYYVRSQQNHEDDVRLADYPSAWDERAPFIEIFHQVRGEPFDYQIHAEGEVKRFHAACLPAGLAFDETSGVISGTPEEPGIYRIVIAVEGEKGIALPARIALAVTGEGGEGGEIPMNPGLEFKPWHLAATDDVTRIDLSGTPNLPFLSGLPGHLESRGYEWIIDPAEPCIYPIEVAVANAHHVWRKTITILMVERNQIFTLHTPGASLSATLGQALTIPVEARQGAAEAFVAFGLPPGLSIDPDTGQISGTPEASGDFRFAVSARSETGDYAQPAQATLSVRPPPVAPTADDDTYDEVVVHGRGFFRYDYPIGTDLDTLSRQLPPGLRWNAVGSYAEVVGHAEEEGVFSFDMPAQDGGLWRVLYAVPPQMKYERIPIPRLELGVDYSLHLTSVDSVEEIPAEGTALIIAAQVKAGLHFRVFDSHGVKIIDVSEGAIPPFKQNGERFSWEAHRLSCSPRRRAAMRDLSRSLWFA